jgi:hypothetical protein
MMAPGWLKARGGRDETMNSYAGGARRVEGSEVGAETSVSGASPNTVETLLRDLAQRRATGVLEVAHPRSEVSHVWIRDGEIYSLNVPGYRPALGIRLLSGGILSPEQLSSAVAEQRSRFAGYRIGEVLVHLGYAPADVIDSFVVEQVHDQLADLLDLPVAGSTFHPGRRVRQDTIEPRPVDVLLAVARERRNRWATVLTDVGGPDVTPTLGPQGRGTAETPLGPHDWALLCRVDGRRDLTELARVCGFTIFETAQVVSDLARAGLLVLPEQAREEDDSPLATVVPLHPLPAAARPATESWSFSDAAVGEPEPVGYSMIAQARIAAEELSVSLAPEAETWSPPAEPAVAPAVPAAESPRRASGCACRACRAYRAAGGAGVRSGGPFGRTGQPSRLRRVMAEPGQRCHPGPVRALGCAWRAGTTGAGTVRPQWPCARRIAGPGPDDPGHDHPGHDRTAGRR